MNVTASGTRPIFARLLLRLLFDTFHAARTKKMTASSDVEVRDCSAANSTLPFGLAFFVKFANDVDGVRRHL